jgi:hypothetical protein
MFVLTKAAVDKSEFPSQSLWLETCDTLFYLYLGTRLVSEHYGEKDT